MSDCQNVQTNAIATGSKIGSLTGIRFYLFLIVFFKAF